MIYSESAFYFTPDITSENNVIAFDEGGSEILATMVQGRYTLTTYLNEILRALNEVGSQIYSGSVDRATRIYTITAPGNFALRVSSGSAGADAFANMGFVGADRTGASSYTGTVAVGSSYRPQFRLQNFVDFDHNQKKVGASVNRSASGQVEVIHFGVDRLMECTFNFITDIDQGEVSPIRTNLTGVADAEAFFEFATTKGLIEFVPDLTDPDEFRTCVLESTPESRDGIDFKLKELFMTGLSGYFTTGLLTFREIEA